MEKRRLVAEEQDKDKQFQLKKEQMELEEKRTSASMEEKITVERLIYKNRRKNRNHERKGQSCSKVTKLVP